MVVALGRAYALIIAVLITLLGTVHASGADHLGLRLVASQTTIAPDGDIYVGLEQTPAAGWHTYWINPGDTGLAPEVNWILPEGVAIDAPHLPAPSLVEYAGGVSYGYEHPSTIIFRLHNRSSLGSGDRLAVEADVLDLVCEKTCEPVKAHLTLSVEVAAGAREAAAGGALSRALAALPSEIKLKPRLEIADGSLKAAFSQASLDEMAREDFSSPEGAYLFFDQEGLVVPKPTQVLKKTGDGFELILERTEESELGVSPHAVIRFANGHSYGVTLDASSSSVTTPAAGNLSQVRPLGFLTAISFAFLGGLILNLMPCVFPILSMKLLALSRAGHDQALARREALVYGGGVLLSFWVLAALLLGARSFGAAVGWGFQLQSPGVTAFLSLLMLLVALNMSGLFEVGAGLQAIAGNIGVNMSQTAHPYLNALLTGALAVIVAAPCSAPFMATAVGAALAQNTATGLAIFTALGAGFAAPFILVAYGLSMSPSLIRLLPKPGPWMLRLRLLLSIPMYGAAIWMAWVFYRQVGALGVSVLALAFALIGASLSRSRVARSVLAIGVVAGAALFVVAASQSRAPSADQPAGENDRQRMFSRQTLELLRNQNRPVLVDMTAAWCVTCKVNERMALSNPKVRDALNKTNTVYLIGDWTRQDAAITEYLSEFGRSGVPLYVYYGSGGTAPVVLPQLLTANDVIAVIESGRDRS